MKKTLEQRMCKLTTVLCLYVFVLGPVIIAKQINVDALYEVLTFPYSPFYLIPYVLVMSYLSFVFCRHFELV